MVKTKWGTKRACPKCSQRFYDLNKNPAVCPNCSYTFDPSKVRMRRRSKRASSEEKVQAGALLKAMQKKIEDSRKTSHIDDESDKDYPAKRGEGILAIDATSDDMEDLDVLEEDEDVIDELSEFQDIEDTEEAEEAEEQKINVEEGPKKKPLLLTVAAALAATELLAGCAPTAERG